MIKSLAFLVFLGLLQHGVNAGDCLQMRLPRLLRGNGKHLKKCKGPEAKLYYEVLNQVLTDHNLNDMVMDMTNLEPLFTSLEVKCASNNAGGNTDRRDFQIDFPVSWVAQGFDQNEWFECDGDSPDDELLRSRALIDDDEEKDEFLALMEGQNPQRRLFGCCYGTGEGCGHPDLCCNMGQCCWSCRRRRLGEGRKLSMLPEGVTVEDLKDALTTACKAKRSEGLKCFDCDNPIVNVVC